MQKIVAILNITQNSFSGDGLIERTAVLNRALNLIEEGCDIIDIGAESTNPLLKHSNQEITKNNELAMLQLHLPDLIELCHARKIAVSLDTRHIDAMSFGLDVGVNYINDVSGINEEAAELIASHNNQVNVVAMHSLSVPPDKNLIVQDDPLQAILKWGHNKIAMLKSYGIKADRIALDPGIGFGNNTEQAWHIIKNLSALNSLETPIWLGHSRKSFLNNVTSLPFADRDIETLVISNYVSNLIITQGLYLRIHNVDMHRRMLTIKNKLYDVPPECQHNQQ